MRFLFFIVCSLFLLLVSGCTTEATPSLPSPTQVPATAAVTPTNTDTVAPTLSPTPTVEIASQVCSPLKGIDRSQLRLITSNPFVLTSPFKEIIEDHPAIDFSFYRKWEYTTFQDFPIQSILPGKVVLVEDNRFPYGYMVLIETPLSQIDPVILSQIPEPTPVPSGYTPEQRCPVAGNPVTFDSSSKSVYVLYAHFSSLPLVKIGDSVSCGDLIGYAGSTGNSAEPHLHLEVRFGPSDAEFESIANYHSSITPEERYDYCIWTISGIFQAVDPAKLLYKE